MKLLKGAIEGDYIFECPGCKQHHEVTTQRKNDSGAQWKFNGNMNDPTFYPSIQIWKTNSRGIKESYCHCIITTGFIQYKKDCMHELKEQTIPMPEIS